MKVKSIYKAVSVAVMLLLTVCYADNAHASNSRKENKTAVEYSKYSTKKLLDLGNKYFAQNNFDSALICYNVITDFKAKGADARQRKYVIEAYNQQAAIHYYMSDFRSAYELLIKALLLSEKAEDASYKDQIYNNLGAIYAYYKKYDMAQLYYEKTLKLLHDNIGRIVLLNNLGIIKLFNGNANDAYRLLNKSRQLSLKHGRKYLDAVLNSIAQYYEKTDQTDSAFRYYKLALSEAKRNNNIEYQADNLSSIGKLFFNNGRQDSAMHYIRLSNKIAADNNFLAIESENYLTLSKIYKSQNNIQAAFSNYEIYSSLKDSVFNAEKFGEINQLQRLYEVAKTNRQIEELIVDQQIKENKIYYQQVIQYITLGVLILVCAVSLFIYFQKKNLNKAYKALVEKNLKIMALQENRRDDNIEKQQSCTLNEDMQTELLNKILTIMEDTQIVCDTEFSLDKLAEMVNSNRTYVSQAINAGLKKNFRSFLNDYRIREAQRLFSSSEAKTHTIEFIASRAGFKSSSAFRSTFKEITGVSPSFYLKSMPA